MSLAGFCVIVTFGQHFYYSHRIRTCRAVRDDAGMNSALADANGFILKLVLIVPLLVATGLATTDVAALLNLETIGRTEAGLVFAVLLASMIGQVYRDTLRGVFMGYGELTRSEVIQAAANILLGVLVIPALLLDASLLVIALIYLAVVPGVVVTAALVDFRRYPELRMGLAWRPARLTRERLASLVAHTVPQLADRILLTGPVVLLGLFGVPSATVVQFNLVRTANNILRARPIAMVFAIELSRQQTQQDWGRFRGLHRRAAAVMGAFGGALVGGMLGLWDLFLPLWTAGAMTADMVMLGLMVAETAVLAFGETSMALLRFGGRMADVARCQLAAAVFAAAFGIPALALGGVYPMLVVLLLGAILFLYLLPAWYARRNMDAPVLPALVLPPVCGIAAASAVYVALHLGRTALGL
jgi:O-antigen/teichoic acid export membrane protein